jgi:hypothetical protein
MLCLMHFGFFKNMNMTYGFDLLELWILFATCSIASGYFAGFFLLVVDYLFDSNVIIVWLSIQVRLYCI